MISDQSKTAWFFTPGYHKERRGSTSAIHLFSAPLPPSRASIPMVFLVLELFQLPSGEFNIARENGPVKIVIFPSNSMVIFHRYVSHYQRVNPIQTPLNHHFPIISYGIPMVFLWFSYGNQEIWQLREIPPFSKLLDWDIPGVRTNKKHAR